MNPEVITIGLGYIGLPTSALIASSGTNVVGVDINQEVVDTINQGKIHIKEPELAKVVSKVVGNGNLKSVQNVGDKTSYEWFVSNPINNYNISAPFVLHLYLYPKTHPCVLV